MSLSFLKEQVKNSRQLANSGSTASPSSKWVRREEIEKQKQMEYEERMKRAQEKKRSRIESLVNARSGNEDTEGGVVKRVMLPKEEIIKRLRVRGEPITYFGETDVLRFERLRKLELMKPMDYNGAENEFFKIVRREEEFQDETDAARQKLEKEDLIFEIEDREPKNDEERVLFWIRDILNAQGQFLECNTGKPNKAEKYILIKTKKDIRPLLAQLAHENGAMVPDDIFLLVLEICKACQKKNYYLANDKYFELAIGNSPWPMGVTMVGIHERSAREKISTASVAHVMNDETQRKYISTLKRIITYQEKLDSNGKLPPLFNPAK